jgi:hypothetical protein
MIITQHFIFLADTSTSSHERKDQQTAAKGHPQTSEKSGINKSLPWAGIAIGEAF